MSFDLTMAFDKASYLNPQLYLMIDSLKDKLPEDTILHVVTNRNKNDELRQYIKETIPSKIYSMPKSSVNMLKSRCRYMLNSFKIKTDKDWVIKIEGDLLFLKHLSIYEELLENDLDLIMEPENRVIFDSNTEKRLWRNIYKAMNIKLPTEKIIFRENNEMGLPLFGTGIICVRKELLPMINDRWINLTEKCEPWGRFNTHPNEQAWTGMVYDEEWKWKLYPAKYKYNIIGHYRKNEFPSTELVDNVVLPKEIICLDWHRWSWLSHISKYNKNVSDIICRNNKYIPDNVWSMSINNFQENEF